MPTDRVTVAANGASVPERLALLSPTELEAEAQRVIARQRLKVGTKTTLIVPHS